MNKELYLEYRKKKEELLTLKKDINLIGSLLERRRFFYAKKSREAMEKIKEYGISLCNKSKDLALEIDLLEYKLSKDCSHDVVVKLENYWRCAICGKLLGTEFIPNKDSIIVDTDNNTYIDIVEETVSYLIENNLDIKGNIEYALNLKINELKSETDYSDTIYGHVILRRNL